ncbi:ribonuclease H-like domain-containing protein [Tanacetum coccineum]
MVTRAKDGISKPLARMNCHVTTTLPIPRSHLHALNDPHWHKAMLDEYNALISNETWAFVPCPANVNVVRSMWLFRHKYNADGSLSSVRCIDLNKLLGYGFSGLLALLHVSVLSTAKPISSSTVLLQCIITLIHGEFSMTDLGSLNYFTPVDIESKLGSDGDPISDPTLYRSLAGALQYLTFTRLDNSYAVQQICIYMHDPHDPHFNALKCILRYVRRTLDHGLQLHVSSAS